MAQQADRLWLGRALVDKGLVRPRAADGARDGSRGRAAAYRRRRRRDDRHPRLSYFVLDIHQPGVEVRPLRQMNGHASFNQVFFTDAEVPPENLLSEVGRGWSVATTTLMHERRGADGIRTWGMNSDQKGRI